MNELKRVESAFTVGVYTVITAAILIIARHFVGILSGTEVGPQWMLWVALVLLVIAIVVLVLNMDQLELRKKLETAKGMESILFMLVSGLGEEKPATGYMLNLVIGEMRKNPRLYEAFLARLPTPTCNIINAYGTRLEELERKRFAKLLAESSLPKMEIDSFNNRQDDLMRLLAACNNNELD